MEGVRENLLDFIGLGHPSLSRALGSKLGQPDRLSTVKPKYSKRATSSVGAISLKRHSLLSSEKRSPRALFNEISSYESCFLTFKWGESPVAFQMVTVDSEICSNGRCRSWKKEARRANSRATQFSLAPNREERQLCLRSKKGFHLAEETCLILSPCTNKSHFVELQRNGQQRHE